MSRIVDEEGRAVDTSTMDGNRCSRYEAPELVNGRSPAPTKASDVWSFGSTVLVSKQSRSCPLKLICTRVFSQASSHSLARQILKPSASFTKERSPLFWTHVPIL